METVSPVTLVQPLQLQAQQENHLVIDLPGEELPVLQALQQAQQLHLFRYIRLQQCGREPLYENSKPASRILQWLQEQGFDLLAEDDSQSPGRPCWILRRNALQLRNRDLQQEVKTLQKQLENSISEKEKLAKQAAIHSRQVGYHKQEHDTLVKLAEEQCTKIEKLTEATEKQAKLVSEFKTQMEQLIIAHNDKVKIVNESPQQIEELSRVRKEQAQAEKLAADRHKQITKHILKVNRQLKKQNALLNAHLKKQNTGLINVRKGLESFVKNEIFNATKQLEAFLSVQHYLETGELIGEMHNWPISPDFALYLIQLLEINDYDLVIEFGSGTSTVLIAKTIAKGTKRRHGKSPVRHIAFEHLAKYHAQTLSSLQQAGLSEAVQLVHAPLARYLAPNGNTYSYYDCNKPCQN